MSTDPSRSSRIVLCIPGSLRRGSYNRRLLEEAGRRAPPGMATILYDELGTIPAFDEDLEGAAGRGPDPVRRLRDRVRGADGILIATPEYNHSIPGVLKNAIDWLSRPPEEVLAGKPVAILGASSGRWGTRLAQAALRQVLNATEALVLATPAVFIREAETLFDPAGRLADATTRTQLQALLAAFARWMDLVGPADRAKYG